MITSAGITTGDDGGGGYTPGPAGMVESFEDASPLDIYAGETGNASIVTSPTVDGSQALAIEGSSAFRTITTTDSSRIVGAGEQLRVWAYKDVVVCFCVQAETGEANLTGYTLGTSASDFFSLSRRDSGSGTTLFQEKDQTIPTGQYVYFDIDLTGLVPDGEITATAYDPQTAGVADPQNDTQLVSGTGTDSGEVFESGGLGARRFPSGDRYLDAIERL